MGETREIEFTPEMIEAGAVALRAANFEVWESLSAAEVESFVGSIYRAMKATSEDRSTQRR